MNGRTYDADMSTSDRCETTLALADERAVAAVREA